MIELYSIKDTARIFGLREARLRYWLQTGFLWPSVRRSGRFFYTFEDLVAIKAAVELLDSGIPISRVRKALDTLRAELPNRVGHESRLKVCSDGHTMVVVDDGVAYEPESGQLVLSFCVKSLGEQIADVLSLPTAAPTAAPTSNAVPEPLADGSEPGSHTEPHAPPSGYRYFLEGREAEEKGAYDAAESCYRRALDLEPSMSAAHINLGNVLHRKGDRDGAREQYEAALVADPHVAEARFNLGNLLAETGETELAIAELRQVCLQHPEFADAHYNLGIILASVGGNAQARRHLGDYLELDPDSNWARNARQYLNELKN